MSSFALGCLDGDLFSRPFAPRGPIPLMFDACLLSEIGQNFYFLCIISLFEVVNYVSCPMLLFVVYRILVRTSISEDFL